MSAITVIENHLAQGGLFAKGIYASLRMHGCSPETAGEVIFRGGVPPAIFIPEVKALADEQEVLQVVAGYRAEQARSITEISVAASPIREVADTAEDWGTTEARRVAQEWKRDVREGRKPITSAYEPEIFDALCSLAEHDCGLPSSLKIVLDELARLPESKGEVEALARRIESRLSIRLEPLAGRKPRPVTWAWRKRIPKKALTLAVGEPGQGKSTFLADLIAKWTMGTLEGDFEGQPVEVVVCSAEDPVDEVLVPRLLAAGADMSRVHVVKLEGPRSDTDMILPLDLDALRYRINQANAKVLILDPVIAYLGGERFDAHRDGEVRKALKPIARVAEELDIAVVAVMHLNKNLLGNVLNRVGGSIGFVAAARSVLLLGNDPDPDTPADDGLRILAHAKSNFGRLAPALRFRVVDRTGVVVTPDVRRPRSGESSGSKSAT